MFDIVTVMSTYAFEHTANYGSVQSNAVGDGPVAAVEFDVSCRSIDGLRQTSAGYTFNADSSLTYSFHVDPDLNDIEISPGKPLADTCKISLTGIMKLPGR